MRGDGSVTDLLVLSQVVLAMQLPFAMFPLLHFTSSRKWMGAIPQRLVPARRRLDIGRFDHGAGFVRPARVTAGGLGSDWEIEEPIYPAAMIAIASPPQKPSEKTAVIKPDDRLGRVAIFRLKVLQLLGRERFAVAVRLRIVMPVREIAVRARIVSHDRILGSSSPLIY